MWWPKAEDSGNPKRKTGAIQEGLGFRDYTGDVGSIKVMRGCR